jgi:hypothetical protein
MTAYGRRSTEPQKPKPQNIEAFLLKIFGETKALGKGSIVLRLTGAGGGDFCLDFSKKYARLSKGLTQSNPTLEVTGDVNKMRAILEGKTSARKEFLAGGIRARGDLNRALDLAVELGMIRRRL